jgi:hypothetical protein
MHHQPHQHHRGVRHRRLPHSCGGFERTVRTSKHDLQARPIYHHIRESIEADLTVVFAALAVSQLIEHRTGWSIKKFVRTARHYRTLQRGVAKRSFFDGFRFVV